jgi:hypothetical protein
LDDVNTTGDEKLNVEIWAEDIWTRIATYDNADGSFDWQQNEIDITDHAFGKVFKLRFMAEGVLSSDILGWFVDNISIERLCSPPQNLTAMGLNLIDIELFWNSPSVGVLKDGGLNWEDVVNGNAAHDQEGLGKQLVQQYEIYFSNNGGGYEFLDITMDTFYIHHYGNIQLGEQYCYYVNAVYEDCDPSSNEACWSYVIGIDDNSSPEILRVYPNPSNDRIYIVSTNVIRELCLLDYSGRMMQCHQLKNQMEFSMDVSGYAPGVYLLRIDTEQGRIVRKIIVNE